MIAPRQVRGWVGKRGRGGGVRRIPHVGSITTRVDDKARFVQGRTQQGPIYTAKYVGVPFGT